MKSMRLPIFLPWIMAIMIAAPILTSGQTVRDKLWLWGHPAGSYNKEYGLPQLGLVSKITMWDAATLMNLPNFIAVSYNGAPSDDSARYYAGKMTGVKNLVWSFTGASAKTIISPDHRARANLCVALADAFPNIVGVQLDDYFAGGNNPRMTTEQLREARAILRNRPKPLDIYLTIYAHEVSTASLEQLQLMDVFELWAWNVSDIPNLDGTIATLQKRAPGKRVFLGVYMYDYAGGRPMPVSTIQSLSEKGLAWLKSGRIDGMIFCSSCVSDLKLDAVDWVKTWIPQAGSQNLPALAK
jgi:hypothetical protein